MTGLSNTTIIPNGWPVQQILLDTMTSEEESANVVEWMDSCCGIPSRPKARRRSSCSALPSNNASWEPPPTTNEDYGNFVVSLESKSNTMPLGTFFRSNSNSFSVSSQSDSDTSICGLSGDDEYASYDSKEKPTTEKKKKKSRKKKLSKDIPDTFSFPSKNEISIHRKMTRRSSWSGAVSSTYPDDDEILEKDKLLYPTEVVEVETPTDGSFNLERTIPEQSLKPIYDVSHDESMAPQQSTTSTGRRMNRRSSWHAATHFSTEQKDGVITSFKLSHSKSVMYEETLVDVENSECLPNYNSVQLEENLSIQRHVPIDSIHSAPALLSDSMFPEKEFKRSLLMAKHIQSGATRAQRRASWSGSTTNYLDYAEQTNNSGDQVQRSTRELFVDIISTCKKQAKYVPHDEEEQPNGLPTEDPTKKGYSFSKETDQSVVSNAATENTTIETSTNRAERRASWHSSCSQEHLVSTSTLNTQYSQQSQHSQKFVMDLSHPQKNWITKDWIEGDENEEMEEDGIGSDHKSTTSGTTSNTSKSRSWILGKGNKDRSSRHMIPKTSSKNLVVVSNANMPHPGQPCREPLEDTPEVGFIQLTAFGDVTVIGHDE